MTRDKKSIERSKIIRNLKSKKQEEGKDETTKLGEQRQEKADYAIV